MLLFVLSGVGIHRSNFLKLGVKICTYNHHCSAPSSRALLVGLAPPTLLGLRSRHCHGINYTHQPPSKRSFLAVPIPDVYGSRCASCLRKKRFKSRPTLGRPLAQLVFLLNCSLVLD